MTYKLVPRIVQLLRYNPFLQETFPCVVSAFTGIHYIWIVTMLFALQIRLSIHFWESLLRESKSNVKLCEFNTPDFLSELYSQSFGFLSESKEVWPLWHKAVVYGKPSCLSTLCKRRKNMAFATDSFSKNLFLHCSAESDSPKDMTLTLWSPESWTFHSHFSLWSQKEKDSLQVQWRGKGFRQTRDVHRYKSKQSWSEKKWFIFSIISWIILIVPHETQMT